MQSLSKRSFRVQMLALSAVVFVAMLVAALFVFFNSVRIIRENRMQDIAIMMDNYEHSLPETVERYYVLLNTLRYSTEIQKAMVQPDPTKYASDAIRIKKELNFYRAACPGIRSIFLNGQENNIYIRTGAEPEVPPEMLTSDSIRPFYSGAYFVESYGKRQPVFYLGSVVSAGGDSDGAGRVILELDGATLAMNVTDDMEAEIGVYCYVLDKNGEIFSSNGAEEQTTERIFSQLPDIKNQQNMTSASMRGYSVSVRHLTPFGITMVVALSQQAILQMALTTFMWTFLMITVLSGLIFFAVYRTMRNVLRPMDEMMEVMDAVDLSSISGQSVRAHVDGFQEMQVMATHFNGMLDKISSLNQDLMVSMENLYRLEVLNRESELNYLRSQINPHFLYNTLETVRGMAVMEHAPLVQKMVGALIRVFRYNVKKGAIVLLGEEMDMIQSYLLIQSLRFGDRLTVEYAIDDAARTCPLPKMLLQPVVENLVQHGIEGSSQDGGRVRIAAKVEDGMLVMDCSDNGKGMSPEELSGIFEDIQATEYVAGKGIGLKNVYGRLKLVYGDRFRFSIASQKDEGTTIHMEIPAGGVENGADQNIDR